MYVGQRDGRKVERSKVVHLGARAARREAALFETAVRAEKPSGPGPGTFDDLLDRWLAHATPDLEATTLQGYRSKLVRIRAELGGLPVDGVTVARLDAFYRGLTAAGLGAKTVRAYHGVISVAFTQALRWGEITPQPGGTWWGAAAPCPAA